MHNPGRPIRDDPLEEHLEGDDDCNTEYEYPNWVGTRNPNLRVDGIDGFVLRFQVEQDEVRELIRYIHIIIPQIRDSSTL
jgi:hypothetical protein